MPAVCALHITISIFHFQISLLHGEESASHLMGFHGKDIQYYTGCLHRILSFHIPSNNIIVYRRSSFVILMGYSIIPLIYFFSHSILLEEIFFGKNVVFIFSSAIPEIDSVFCVMVATMAF